MIKNIIYHELVKEHRSTENVSILLNLNALPIKTQVLPMTLMIGQMKLWAILDTRLNCSCV